MYTPKTQAVQTAWEQSGKSKSAIASLAGKNKATFDRCFIEGTEVIPSTANSIVNAFKALGINVTLESLFTVIENN